MNRANPCPCGPDPAVASSKYPAQIEPAGVVSRCSIASPRWAVATRSPSVVQTWAPGSPPRPIRARASNRRPPGRGWTNLGSTAPVTTVAATMV